MAPDIGPELREDLLKMQRDIPEMKGLSLEQLYRIFDITASKRDAEWLYENHYFIKDKAGQIRPFGLLKPAQRKLLAVLEYCRKNKIPPRIIIGKARKQGLSTMVAAIFLDQVMKRQVEALVVSHEKDSAKYILEIYRRMYERFDLDKPALYKGKGSLRELRFEQHDGKILIASAGNEYSGTGMTPQLIHMSESSKWYRGEETRTALLQSIGDDPSTVILDESTFNGFEQSFLPSWEGAHKNSKLTWTFGPGQKPIAHFEVTNHADWNHWIPLFVSVTDDPDARLPFKNSEERSRFEQTLTDYERNAMERYGASLEFVNWRRYVKKVKCQGNEDIVKQEYPLTPEEAVRALGDPRFNIAQLDLMPIEDGMKGGLRKGDGWDEKVMWKPDHNDILTRFKEPKPGHHYVIGCDPVEGEEGEPVLDNSEEAAASRRKDSAVAIVLDVDNGNEQVATLQCKFNAERLFPPLYMLAMYYNRAYVVIEANNTGQWVCNLMREKYPESLLYHRDEWDLTKSVRRRAVGHKTYGDTREMVISRLADAINESRVLLHDVRTVMECKYFVSRIRKKAGIRKKRYEAARGHHDDHVFGLALAILGTSVWQRKSERVLNHIGASPLEVQRAEATRSSSTGY